MKLFNKTFLMISMLLMGINCFAQEYLIGTYTPINHSTPCDIKYSKGILGVHSVTLTVPMLQEFSDCGELLMNAKGDQIRTEFSKMKELMIEHTAKAKTNPKAYQKPKKIYTSNFVYSLNYHFHRPESKKEEIMGRKLSWKIFFDEGLPYIFFEHALGNYILSLDNVEAIITATNSENINRCKNKPQKTKAANPNTPIGI